MKQIIFKALEVGISLGRAIEHMKMGLYDDPTEHQRFVDSIMEITKGFPVVREAFLELLAKLPECLNRPPG